MFLLPGNALQRLWPWGPPGKAPEEDCSYQEIRSRGSGGGFRPGKVPEQDCYCLEIASRGLARESPHERLQNKIVLTKKCLPEALARVSPRKGFRTRSLLPGSAFKRLWSEGPRREGVARNPGESQNEGLEVQAKRKCTRGNPLGLSGSPGSFHLSSGSSLGSLEFPPLIY